MTKAKHWIVMMGVLMSTLMLNSCLSDDGYSLGDMWISVATVESQQNSNDYFFRLDDGTTLWPAAGYYIGQNMEDGQRVLLTYTVLSDELSGFDHYIKVNDIETVLTKQIAEDKGVENDSYYGNDPVLVRKISVGQRFLTIWFEARYGGSKKHFVNLVQMENESIDNYFEFRHNAYDDPASDMLLSPVCFDLKSIDTEGETIELVININTFDGEIAYKVEYNSHADKLSVSSIPNDANGGHNDKVE